MLGKRMKGRRTKSGSRVFKVRRKNFVKGAVGVKKLIRRAIASNNEYNIHYNYLNYKMAPFVKTSTKTLNFANFYQLQTYPAQSLTSSGRQGKSIKNITQQFKFNVRPFNWLDQLASGTYDPTANDQIVEMRIRIIIFTSDVFLNPTTDLSDFWNMDDNNALPEMNRVNRTKYTVIKDKVIRYTNETYYANMDPPARTVLLNGAGKSYAFSVKRRWKSITFPTDTSVTPADHKKNTYIAILPEIENVAKDKYALIWHMVMTMYYTG